MRTNAVDFLNFVFGSGVETVELWKIVLYRCKKKFGQQFSFPPKVKFGCLLHAVLWHCKFSLKFYLSLRLFEIEKPFD
jgi:hypothetical protein